MALNLTKTKQPQELKPRIIVFGVGGAGCNAVNNMIHSKLEGVECVVANTDAQALALCLAERKIQLGTNITQGLGAGSRPEIGRAAAEEAYDEIATQLQGGHMVFITAGMGGGTGTGAAPVIARAAREHGLLTVGVVTKPFHFEGQHRMRLAETGLDELQEVVDTLIVIPNQNLFRVANEKTTFADAFHMADQVLHSGVRSITDLMVMPGLINLDFADIRTVMGEMGKAMMGAGEAEGENRAIAAAERAISNPLLDDVSMAGARGLLINISGGGDLTLFEVDEAANRVRDEVDPAANIIFGSVFDDSLKGKIRVSVFATGIGGPAAKAKTPDNRLLQARPAPVRAPIGEAAPAPAERRPAAESPKSQRAEPAPAKPARPAAEAQPMPAPVPAPAPAPAPRLTPAPAARSVESNTLVVAPPAPAMAQPDMFAAGQPAPVAAEPPAPAPAAMPQPVAAAPAPAPVARPAPLPPAAETPRLPRVESPPPLRGPMRAEEPAAKPARRDSFFGLWRSRRAEAPAEPAPQPQAQPQPSRRAAADAEPQTQRTAAPSGERVARFPARPEPRAEAAPAAKPEGESDILDIPAFLRRQVN